MYVASLRISLSLLHINSIFNQNLSHSKFILFSNSICYEVHFLLKQNDIKKHTHIYIYKSICFELRKYKRKGLDSIGFNSIQFNFK